MYNLLVALGLGALVFALGTAAFGWIAGVFPAVFVSGLALFLLGRRTAQQVEKELASLASMLQERRIDDAQALLVRVKVKYGPWQFLLASQIDAQLGMLDYLQLKFDDARPRLESGKWRNWTALTCLGAIHWRQGRKDEAWKCFAQAADASPKETLLYAVWSTLLSRDGKRAEALEAVGRGLKEQPGSQLLKDLQSKLANDKKVDTRAFGDAWFQFFPEDLMKEVAMKGRRGPGPMPTPTLPQPRYGARHAPRR